MFASTLLKFPFNIMNVAIIYVITMRIITVIRNFVLCIHLTPLVYGNAYVVFLPLAHWIISKHIMQCFLSDCELITIRIWWIQSDEMDARGRQRYTQCVQNYLVVFEFAKFTFTKFDATDVFELCHVRQTLDAKIIWFQSHAQRRTTRSNFVRINRDKGIT